MKYIASLPSLFAALCLAAPATGLSRDHHDHHDSDDCHSDRSWDHHSPSISFYHSYPYSYGSYPSYYGGYPYSYGPSVGLSYSTRPTYYEDTSYRGVPVSNDTDDLAVDVQRSLARRGYYRGEIDGDIGPGTRAAIRRYQYERRLEVTGRIDRSLLRSLGLE